MHTLPRHPETGRHLRDWNTSGGLQDRPVTLLNNGQLHQRQSRPPAPCRPQTSGDSEAESPAPVSHLVGLQCQASTGTGQFTSREDCERYLNEL
jgi:hypothetical protein